MQIRESFNQVGTMIFHFTTVEELRKRGVHRYYRFAQTQHGYSGATNLDMEIIYSKSHKIFMA